MQPSDDFIESFRDARAAQVEQRAALSLIGDRLAEARTAASAGNIARVLRALNAAGKELEAAHGYRCAVDDAHRDIGRCLRSTEAAA